MVEVTPVRTEDEYDAALERIALLMDAPPDGAKRDELEVLSVLVERYEEQHYPIAAPDPVAAIEFRMDQANLARRDLIPYLGSRARVSEVLARKRPLTMAMARDLHNHLGIPAESLMQPATTEMELSLAPVEVERFPLAEMASVGWIPPITGAKAEARELIDELYERAFGIAGSTFAEGPVVMGSWGRRADPAAMQAWCLQAVASANAFQLVTSFVPGIVTPEFLRTVARLSAADEGPVQARDYLAQYGIALQIVPQLARTHLDGATLWAPDSYPVIALTLRNDRVARFWSGLLHGLAHLGLHAGMGAVGFLDDLDLPSRDPIEQQADEWAREALIPSVAWDSWSARQDLTQLDVLMFAEELGVHPTIVAERMRDEFNNQRRFPGLVGKGLVGLQFGLTSSASD